jgi:hypothetical protein
MQHKVIKFARDDIAIDYEHITKCINRHCRNGGGDFRVSGLCQTASSVFFSLEHADGGPWQYVLAPFTSCSDDDVLDDLDVRWHSGFSTKGLIRLSASYIGLFEIPVDVVDLTESGDSQPESMPAEPSAEQSA